MDTQQIETLIIGAGQAGLATGYHLQRRGRALLIIDENARVGDNWRHQWDTLRLYTPAKYDGLPGLPFPAASWHCPQKDEVGDYLERYALHFDLPVRTSTQVERLEARSGGGYLAKFGNEVISCENVVVATGTFGRTPNVPGFAADLEPVGEVYPTAGRIEGKGRWLALGHKTGLMDADVYGPNVPLMMGINRTPVAHGERIQPLEQFGVKLMSMGFLSPGDKPLVWRGPMLHSVIQQFLRGGDWGELDYLVIDLPPGTGDVQLSLAQQVPLAGAVIVATPQQVALDDALKAVAMFQKLDNQYEGTGIGLAIVRKVVERMGGKVGVESEPDQGSRFWVELRIAPKKENA
jgi:hypothetical protein